MVERRNHPRWPKTSPVQVCPLDGSGRVISGLVQDWSECGAGLVLTSPLATGTPVRLDLDDELSLGEVVYSQSVPAGFLVGVRIKHTLQHLREFRTIMRRHDWYGPRQSGKGATQKHAELRALETA
jgi:hypothetical protein